MLLLCFFTGSVIPCGCVMQVYKEVNITGVDVSQFETQQVFYPSKDGTEIPMFLVHRKVRHCDLWALK